MLDREMLIEGREEEDRGRNKENEETDKIEKGKWNSHQQSRDSSGENINITAMTKTARPRIITVNATDSGLEVTKFH